MTNLLHNNTSTRKTGLLGIVSLKSDLLRRVLYPISGDRWVMRDLLYDEVGLSAVVAIWPIPVEQPGFDIQEARSVVGGDQLVNVRVLTLRGLGSMA